MPEIDVIVYGPGGFRPDRPDKNIVKREKAVLPDASLDEAAQLRSEVATLTEEVKRLKGEKTTGVSARMALTDVLAASNGPDFPFVPVEPA